MMKRPSVYIPLILLAYLGLMAWIGRYELQAGRYLYYFGLIAITLTTIAGLHIFLRRREKLRTNTKPNPNPKKQVHK